MHLGTDYPQGLMDSEILSKIPFHDASSKDYGILL